MDVQITGQSQMGTPKTAEELYNERAYVAAFDTLNSVMKTSGLTSKEALEQTLTADQYTLLYFWLKAGVRATHEEGCSVKPAIGLLNVVDVLAKSPNRRHKDLARAVNKHSLAGVKRHDQT